jgi:hypothetical protein
MSGPESGHVRSSFIFQIVGLIRPLYRVPERFIGYVIVPFLTSAKSFWPDLSGPFSGF